MIRKRTSSYKPRIEALEERLLLATIANPALVFSASSIVKGKTQVDLFVTTANGASTIQLTNDKVADTLPVWSPDGARIAFLKERLKDLLPFWF